MEKENPVAISAEELNSVLNSIKDVNTQHIHEDYKSGVGLSQAELDNLFNAKAEKTSDEGQDSRAQKIAKRNAHAAEVLQQANAKLHKTISVIYGTAQKDNAFISNLKAGDSIELDRLADQSAEIIINGKVFAHGLLEVKDGHASVKIVDIIQK